MQYISPLCPHALVLDGVALHQAYQYACLHGTNRPLVNYYVVGLVVLDALHTVLAIHVKYAQVPMLQKMRGDSLESYRNLVTNYFGPDHLVDPLWSLSLQPVATGAIIVACQMFFAWRVYKVVHKMYQPLVKYTGGMFVVELAAALAFTIIAFRTAKIHTLNEYSWLQSGGYGVVITADAIMTTVLVVALHRSRTEFKRTNSIIDLLTAYAICTGLVTLIFATVCFVSALVIPNNLLFGAFDIVCVKVYINSMLAALNARPTPATRELQGETTGDIFLTIMPQHSARTVIGPGGCINSSSSQIETTKAESTVINIKVTNEVMV